MEAIEYVWQMHFVWKVFVKVIDFLTVTQVFIIITVIVIVVVIGFVGDCTKGEVVGHGWMIVGC